jgi:hypothetical protein
MRKKAPKRYRFTIRSKKFQVIADKVLFFRILQNLHGRFWGIAALMGMLVGMGICFLIRPDMWHISTAFSDFGRDVRTAPFFSGTMFFAAYGLWRWQKYLRRTYKRSGPILLLILFTIIGLYLVALMPVSWKPWPYRIHFFGVILAGFSMAATVVVDALLTKTKQSKHMLRTRIARLASFVLIVIGGYITFGSAETVAWYRLSLLGEVLILFGYTIWVFMKTRQGEGPRSKLSGLIQKVIIVK